MAITPVQARDAVRQFHATTFASQLIQFDNQPPTNSAGKVVSIQPTDTWMRTSFHINVSEQVEMAGIGANTHRHTGMLIHQLFGPVDKGDADLWVLAQQICVAYRSLIVGGVRFSTANPNRVGRDGPWWQVNVKCPFHFDEIG